MNVFINILVSTVVIFLGFLCTQLIYSLMLNDVEERTYEYAMLRALGFNNDNLIIAIFIQTFPFALPGIFIGGISAAILNAVIRYFIFSQ